MFKYYIYCLGAIIGLAAGATTISIQRAQNVGLGFGGVPWVDGVTNGTIVSNVESIGDLNNPRDLVGQSHNVFVGKVLKVAGNKQLSQYNQGLQFLVRPIINVKGFLRDDLVINQFYSIEKQALLNVGSTYVFLTRYHPEWDMHTIGSSFNHILLEERVVGDGELLELANANTRLNELRLAYPDETPFIHDVENNRSYNSYATRCLDANGELIDDTIQIANEKKGLPKAECVTRLTPEARFTETPAPTAVPTPIITPKPSLPDVEPVRTPPPPPAIPGL